MLRLVSYRIFVGNRKRIASLIVMPACRLALEENASGEARILPLRKRLRFRQLSRAGCPIECERRSGSWVLLWIVKRDVVQLPAPLDAEDHWISRLQSGQRLAQGFQRIQRRAIEQCSTSPGCSPKREALPPAVSAVTRMPPGTRVGGITAPPNP